MNFSEILVKSEAEKRLADLSPPPLYLKQMIQPTSIGKNQPAFDSILLRGYHTSDHPSYVITTVDTKSRQRTIIKIVKPINGTHPFYWKYQDEAGVANAMQAEARWLRNINTGLKPYIANILPVETIGESMLPHKHVKDDLIVIGSPINDTQKPDPRYPVALVMNDLLIGSSARDKLEHGETQLVISTLAKALNRIHDHDAVKIPKSNAKTFSSFDAFTDKVRSVIADFVDALEVEIPGIPRGETRLTKENVLSVFEGIISNHAYFSKLFERAIDNGEIIRIHGDLQASHILYSSNGVQYNSALEHYWQFIDAIDFNDLLEHGHRLSDVAFLMTDMKLWVPEKHHRLINSFLYEYSRGCGDLLLHKTAAHFFRLYRWEKPIIMYFSQVKYKRKFDKAPLLFKDINEQNTQMLAMLSSLR